MTENIKIISSCLRITVKPIHNPYDQTFIVEIMKFNRFILELRGTTTGSFNLE
jgi:hypothetical protein